MFEMETIKKLKAKTETWNSDWEKNTGKLESLKDVLGLMKRLERKEVITDIWEELKAKIKG